VKVWQREHGRHDLPWQVNKTPYRVWVTEIMLQQTQVKTVIPFFDRFMQTYPDLSSLALADLDKVLRLWSGLGYYRRARLMHRTARLLFHDADGVWPLTIEGLSAFPGIGPSTAAAIISASMGQRGVILDGNVKRILARYACIPFEGSEHRYHQRLMHVADALTPYDEVDVYNQGMMDLGSSICSRSTPDCKACPVSSGCQAFEKGLIDQYPTRRRAKAKRVIHYHLLLLSSGQRYYLEQRPSSGIWSGLWSFPLLEDLAAWRQAYGFQAPLLENKSLAFEHILTHQHWKVSVHMAEIMPRKDCSKQRPEQGQEPVQEEQEPKHWPGQWLDLPGIKDLALPAPISSLLPWLK